MVHLLTQQERKQAKETPTDKVDLATFVVGRRVNGGAGVALRTEKRIKFNARTKDCVRGEGIVKKRMVPVS